jgi:hypothetical protein
MPRATGAALNSFGRIARVFTFGKYTPGLTREGRRLAHSQLTVRPDGFYQGETRVGGNRYLASEFLRSQITALDLKRSDLREMRALCRIARSFDGKLTRLVAGEMEYKDIYLKGFFPSLMEKISGREELKAWNAEILKAISELKTRKAAFNYTTCVLPELVDRSKTIAELRAWHEVVTAHLPENGHTSQFIKEVIPEILDKAQTPEEYQAWAKIIADLSNIFPQIFKNPLNQFILAKMVKFSTSLKELKSLQVIIRTHGSWDPEFDTFISCLHKSETFADFIKWDQYAATFALHCSKRRYPEAARFLPTLIGKAGSLEEFSAIVNHLDEYGEYFGSPADYIKKRFLEILDQIPDRRQLVDVIPILRCLQGHGLDPLILPVSEYLKVLRQCAQAKKEKGADIGQRAGIQLQVAVPVRVRPAPPPPLPPMLDEPFHNEIIMTTDYGLIIESTPPEEDK